MPSETVRPRASRAPQALRAASAAPVGVWLGASYALGHDIRTDRPYPHLEGTTVTGHSGRQVLLGWRDCAACMTRRASRHDDHTIPPPPLDTAALAAGDSH